MTKLEELLDADAATLKAMSDEQLLEFFKPFINVTRPEFAPKPKTASDSGGSLVSPEELNNLKQKVAKLKALGIEVDEAALLKKLKQSKK
jgi:hypothetical protein